MIMIPHSRIVNWPEKIHVKWLKSENNVKKKSEDGTNFSMMNEKIVR